MPFQPIVPAGSGKPLAPYSPGAVANGILYVSGTLPLGPTNDVLHVGDVAAQTRHVLETIKAVVEAAGGTMADVAMNHIFLTDWADYGAINTVYAEYFPGDKPARYCVKASLVKQDALIEIASVAHVG